MHSIITVQITVAIILILNKTYIAALTVLRYSITQLKSDYFGSADLLSVYLGGVSFYKDLKPIVYVVSSWHDFHS